MSVRFWFLFCQQFDLMLILLCNNQIKIAPSYLRGAFYDKAVEAVGVFWNVKRYLISSR